MKVTIDKEIQALVPPLLPAELAGLEGDIRAHGCRDALVTSRGHGILLDGHSRLEICERLGVPYHTTEIELADRDAAKVWTVQNQLTNRRNLTAFQRAELALRLEPMIAAQAKERMLRGKADPTQKSAEGQTRLQVARIAGVSHDTISKVKYILQHGSEEMKQNLRRGTARCSINAEHKKIIVAAEKAQAIEAVRKAAILPKGKYHVAVVDPPWCYAGPSYYYPSRYPSMSQEEIIQYMREKVVPFFYESAILFLWSTNTHLHMAFHVLEEIGFTYRTTITWAKDYRRVTGQGSIGHGYWLRGQTEHCLMATIGKPVVTLTNQTTLLHGQVREDGRKPQTFYDLIRSLCHGRMAEHFARERHAGFDCYGAEVDKFRPDGGCPGTAA